MCSTSITESAEPRVWRSFVPSGTPRASMGCPGSTRCSVRRGWKQSLRGVLCRRSALCLSLLTFVGWSNVQASASSPLLHAMSLSTTEVGRAPRLSALSPLASTPLGCSLQAPGCRPRSSDNTPANTEEHHAIECSARTLSSPATYSPGMVVFLVVVIERTSSASASTAATAPG